MYVLKRILVTNACQKIWWNNEFSGGKRVFLSTCTLHWCVGIVTDKKGWQIKSSGGLTGFHCNYHSPTQEKKQERQFVTGKVEESHQL